MWGNDPRVPVVWECVVGSAKSSCMRLLHVITIVLTLVETTPCGGAAQTQKVSQVVIVVDATKAMQRTSGQKARLIVAQWAASDVLDIVPARLPLGVIAL